jgi:hypothetical protein
LSVNDTREIGTLGCHLSPQLYGHRLNNPKVVVDSACVAKTSGYLFERKSDSVEYLKSHRYAQLGVSARNTQYVDQMRGSVDLVFVSEAILTDRGRAAPAGSSRDLDFHRTTF